MVAAVLGVAVIGLAILPTLEAHRDADRLDIELSPIDYVSAWGDLLGATEPETEAFAELNGEQLKADVHRPEEPASPAPAVVFVHGGAWQWGQRGATPWWNEWLTEQGYAVFDIEYRLEPAPTWRAAPGDVQCAVGWVRSHADRFGVDPDRLVLMGSSAGGHLALLAAYAAGETAPAPTCDVDRTDVAAVVALYPPTDLAHNYALADRVTPLDGQGVLERFTGGTPDTAPEAYRVASPISHVGADAPATLLVQGARDQMQSPADTVALAERLDDEGVAHRLVWFEHAGHGFHGNWGGWASQMTRPLLSDFLEDHVGPDRADSPLASDR